MELNYPQNAPFALCLTHDVDRLKKQYYHYIRDAAKNGFKKHIYQFLKSAEVEPYYNFEQLIEIEQEYGANSTFLFMHETVRKPSFEFMGRYKLTDKRARSAIEYCLKHNRDIGFHGSFYSYNDFEKMQSEYSILKNIVGENIVSTRQHFLNFDENQTHKFQKKCGCMYDSTVGYSKKLGTGLPYHPYLTHEGLVEFPITIMDTLDFSDQNIYKSAIDLFEEVAENKGVCTLDFHQCRYNATDAPKAVKLYEQILKAAKIKGAFIGSMAEIGEHLLPQLKSEG